MNAAAMLRSQMATFLREHIGSEETTFVANTDEHELTCQFSRIDGLACGLSQLSATRKGGPLGLAQRRRACDELVQKIHYLLEPVRVIEADEDAIQIRSDPPEDSDECRRYYELTALSDRMVLTRYEKRANTPRRMVSCVITHEVLDRLIGDVIGALG